MPARARYSAMASSSAKVPSPSHDKAIRELNRGFELARQLRVLLRRMPRDDLRRESAVVLSQEVLRSLTVALGILESSGEAFPCLRPTDYRGRTDSDGQMARKSAGEERRGLPGSLDKWRKEHSRTELTATPYLDGHQWRQYGQKRIAGAKFTRCYYRCAYSDLDGCKATKQVQQAEGDQNEPHMFRVNYNNEHTCRNSLIAPSIESRSLELMGRTTEGSLQNQAWLNFRIPDARRCEEAMMLSFSSPSSDQNEAGGAPNSSSCGQHFASPGTFLGASATGPDADRSLPNPNNIINQAVVSGGPEDELLGYEIFLHLDLADV